MAATTIAAPLGTMRPPGTSHRSRATMTESSMDSYSRKYPIHSLHAGQVSRGDPRWTLTPRRGVRVPDNHVHLLHGKLRVLDLAAEERNAVGVLAPVRPVPVLLDHQARHLHDRGVVDANDLARARTRRKERQDASTAPTSSTAFLLNSAALPAM